MHCPACQLPQARLLCLSLGEAFCADDAEGQEAAAALLRDTSRWAADDRLQVGWGGGSGWRCRRTAWCVVGPSPSRHAPQVYPQHETPLRPTLCVLQALAAELVSEALVSTEDEVPLPAADQ